MIMRLAILCAAVAFAGCAPQPSLLGSWQGESSNASGSRFEFRRDGTATWHIGQPFEIQYRAVDPTSLDLYGFAAGPLKDRTLYCLVELNGADRFRMDCEPSARPSALDPEQTQAFVRLK